MDSTEEDILVIENFQSHELTTLPLVRGGVNVLIGDSRCGKSAVIRALEAVALNSPVDRRDGSKRTAVTWKGVSRIRSNTDNKYEVGGAEYKAMRTSVPKPVADRLRISDINFRPQHRSYFLLQDTPGAVARSFNELADLGLIDHVSSTLAAERRAADGELAGLQTRKEKLQEQAEALTWAEDADHETTVVEHIINGVEHTRKELEGLAVVLRELERVDERLAGLADLPTSWRQYDNANVDLRNSHAYLKDMVEVLGKFRQVDAALAGLPDPEELAKVSRAIGGMPDAVATSALRADLATLKEYDEELHDCPVPEPDIQLLADVISSMPAVSADLPELLAAFRGLGDTPPDAGEDVADLTSRVGQVVDQRLGRLKLRKDLGDLQSATDSLKFVTAEAEVLKKNFARALAEAGQCPLCGR